MPYAQAVTMINELPPMVQLPTQQPLQGNPYYEEVVKDHPGIQSKIRQLDNNPYGKYEETIPRPDPPAQVGWNNIPDYPVMSSYPGSVHQNYLPSSMVSRAQSQHLPIATNVPTRYDRPMVESNAYPVVENYQLSCRDVMAHIKECPICSHLYGKNDKIYTAIISALILIILFLVFRFSRR